MANRNGVAKEQYFSTAGKGREAYNGKHRLLGGRWPQPRVLDVHGAGNLLVLPSTIHQKLS
jgi:hypothetical protein